MKKQVQRLRFDLNHEIIYAIKAKDIESLKRLRCQIGLERWLNRFDGNVPIEAWLENDNPIVRFEKTSNRSE